jgi:hypothetical protein
MACCRDSVDLFGGLRAMLFVLSGTVFSIKWSDRSSYAPNHMSWHGRFGGHVFLSSPNGSSCFNYHDYRHPHCNRRVRSQSLVFSFLRVVDPFAPACAKAASARTGLRVKSKAGNARGAFMTSAPWQSIGYDEA